MRSLFSASAALAAGPQLKGQAPGWYRLQLGDFEITALNDGTLDLPKAAIDRINAIANPQLPKVGERFLGTVVKTTAFGAFVSLVPGRDGLVHISKLGNGKRVNKVEDVVNVGSKLQVEIADIDERGKISLIPVVEETAAEAAPAGEE